jgi:hypothetical protein
VIWGRGELDCVEPQLTFWFSPAGGATIALVGVAVTGLVTWWLSGRARRWQLEDDRRTRLIQRGEEAYSLIRNWHLDQHHWYLHNRLVMEGKVDYNSAMDAVNEQGGRRSLQIERVGLILEMYFSDVASDWQNVVSAIQSASQVENNFRAAYKEGLLSSDWHKTAFDEAWVLAEQRLDKTMKALSSAMKSIVKV